MKNIINIQGIKVYAYHGCLEEEAKIGGNYVVDVRLLTDFSKAVDSDELADAVDYCTVFDISRREMKIRSKLIEEVCHRIYLAIHKEMKGILGLHVKVTKLVPPMNGDVASVSVEIKDDQI